MFPQLVERGHPPFLSQEEDQSERKSLTIQISAEPVQISLNREAVMAAVHRRSVTDIDHGSVQTAIGQSGPGSIYTRLWQWFLQFLNAEIGRRET